MRARTKSRIAWHGTRSEGLWAPITLSEHAQCLVCRALLVPGEEVMCSPGRWVRHTDCVWPAQARGVDVADRLGPQVAKGHRE